MADTSVLEDRGAQGFARELGLLDSVMIVTGSMIGSGIFIVSANIARQVGSAGWLLAAWIVSGLLVMAAALSFGELAAMMPRVGGQYVFLREAYSPLLGFLYGWIFFLVIQTGTIAAVAVAFARFLGVIAPGISSSAFLIKPIDVSPGYAVSLSVQQFVAIALIVVLSVVNAFGLRTGKLIQNVLTAVKTLALAGLILLGILVGRNAVALSTNFSAPWAPRDAVTITPDLFPVSPISAQQGGLALLTVFLIALVGPLFSASAWNDVTFAAAEIRNPKRNLPLALAAGVGLVSLLYVLANVAYLVTLPLAAIRSAPEDRVATAALQAILGGGGASIMAVAIMISTFGCNNGLILAGARVYYAMACDGLFFRAAGRLNRWRVPGVGLAIQCVWASLLVIPRTRLRDASGLLVLDKATGAPQYGNLYTNLLEYVVFAVLLFYVITLLGLFILRRKRPDAERPYRVWGYPWVPLFYVGGATLVVLALFVYRTQTTWPGLLFVLAGIPVYLLWRRVGLRHGD
ncbi:MAG TPA: amino acid permease [Thermoanaerobaculia bacterium]|jgi:APA family basic amino acid/polyamine antiporter|nr:amino acid permease [Thermoanaerobaculia bacterium]